MSIEPPFFIEGPNGAIACRVREGQGPGIVWFGGFRSDMLGSKASALDTWAIESGQAFLRFDYSGHGESAGEFEAGTIGGWLADACAAFDQCTAGPQILVGSSMGAWIASLLARLRPAQVAAAVFIAPAPDFTEILLLPSLDESQRRSLLERGSLSLTSEDGTPPQVFTRRLFEEARDHLMMNSKIPIHCPVRIFQGMADEAVPWQHALAFAQCLESQDVQVLLTKSGDHRLSREDDIARLCAMLDALTDAVSP